MDEQFKIQMQVNPQHNRFPYCLVWTALPCITCCMPCIGHTGICKSDGTIYDFVGRGPMHSGDLAFGKTLKYLVLDHSAYTAEQWDQALYEANRRFEKTDHNIFAHNCHHHVAQFLNILKYKGKSNWGQVDIAWLAAKSTHVSWCSYYVYIIFLCLAAYFLL